MSAFVDNIKTEVNHLTDISQLHDSGISDSTMKPSDLGPAEEMDSDILDEFDKSVRKITSNLSLFRDMGVREDLVMHERALADSLASLYMRTDEINERLTMILLKSDETIDLNTSMKINDLRSQLTSFHDDLGLMTRVAVRYGCLKAESASMEEMCGVATSIERLWRLYADLRQAGLNEKQRSPVVNRRITPAALTDGTVAEVTNECTDLAIVKPEAKNRKSESGAAGMKTPKTSLFTCQTLVIFTLGVIVSAMIFLVLFAQGLEIRGSPQETQCSDWLLHLRDYIHTSSKSKKNMGLVPF